MKKLIRRLLSLGIVTVIGVPQINAAVPNWGWTTTTESEEDTYDADQSDGLSYVIEIKNANYSKQNTRGLKGLVYTDNTYTNAAWPKVEGYHPLSLTDGTYYNSHTVAQIVRQFGVSMGVVYWINPDKDCIFWWNTVTGESGSTTPTLKYPDNFTEEAEAPNVPFTFDASYTGPGSITHDWHGNLVHMWNGEAGWLNSSYVKGYATYKAPTKYGELIDFHPKISIMSQTQYPVYRRKQSGGVLVGSTGDISNYNYYSPKSVNGPLPNPNYPANGISWVNASYHKARSEDNWIFRRTDFMGASGNLWAPGIKNGGEYTFSDYYAGYSGGYVFHTRNYTAFGQMFADGQYTNWYLNYLLTMYGGNVEPNTTNSTIIIPVTSTENSNSAYWWTNSVSYNNYLHECLFAEFDELDYFWNVPNTGTGEFNVRNRGGYKWPGYRYNMVCGQNVSTVKNGTDWMSAPEVDSIKGHRVMIHNYWLNYQPQDVDANGTPRRNGQIAFRSCPYTNITYDAEADGKNGVRKDPNRNYAMQGWAYAYNKTQNLEPVGLIYTDRKTTVNCWSELERVNNNVFAAYTYVPTQGFSKYFITAVEKNNPVTNLEVTRQCYGEGTNTALGTVDVLISWDAQKYDRETLHRYQIYYQSYKRDANGELVSDCDQTWQPLIKNADGSVGCVDIGTATTGSYTHKNVPYGGMSTADTSDDYDITYLYMVIPIYDDSDHWGTEAIATSTVTSSVPRIPVTGKMIQQTETVDSRTLYSFNLELNDLNLTSDFQVPYSDSNTKATTSKYVVVATDEATSTALSQNTSVTLVDASLGTIGNKGIADANYSFTSHNCNHYTGCSHDGITFDLNGKYYVEVNLASAVSSGTLPSIVFHNVNPSVTYNVKVFVIALRNYNFIESDLITATMEIPMASTTMSGAEFQPLHLKDDYSGMSRDEILPMGAKLRRGSDEVTNPVTLSAANTLGTRGSVINPLAVTDEVLANWNVQYTYHVLQNGADVLTTTLDASDANAALYSNSTNVIVDILGLPVAKTDWDIYSTMGLSDEQKAANENITKQGYDVAGTAANQFSTKVDVAYTRKTNSVTVSNTNGSASAIAMPAASPFNTLSITYETSLGALFQRTSTHWDKNCVDNGGYYKYYYDAGIQWIWGDYSDNLNKYIGYHAVTQTECAGHYETSTSTTWTQFYAAHILSDTYVSEYNKTLYSSGLAEFMAGIGYDGTNDWSALATESRKLPMNIHYVWGGNAWVTTDAERKAIKMNVILTTDYPMIEGVTLKVNEYVDGQNYSMVTNAASPADAESAPTTMNMITVPTPLNNINVDYTTTVTGVEGVLTNACGGVQLYPNPVENAFTLRAPMTIGNVQIFTMDGQLVKVMKEINDTTAEINVAELPQGIYIVNTLGVSQLMIKK